VSWGGEMYKTASKVMSRRAFNAAQNAEKKRPGQKKKKKKKIRKPGKATKKKLTGGQKTPRSPKVKKAASTKRTWLWHIETYTQVRPPDSRGITRRVSRFDSQQAARERFRERSESIKGERHRTLVVLREKHRVMEHTGNIDVWKAWCRKEKKELPASLRDLLESK